MGAKVDNTPRFVCPRVIDTQTASQSISMSDSSKHTIYTMPKDSFVTIDFTLGEGSAVNSVYVYLNGTKIANAYGSGMKFESAGALSFPDRIISAIVPIGTTNVYSVSNPMILKAGDVISISRGEGSGSGSRVFNIIVKFWG